MTNFLADYRIYSDGNEAPREFHDWCGLYALSAFCGPRIWFDMGPFNIQPNLYILLVGPPGIRKTTAMNMAKDLCRKVGKVPMMGQTETRQNLLNWMADDKAGTKFKFDYQGSERRYTQACGFCSEFVNLVMSGGAPTEYISLLTDLYDPQPAYEDKTISRGHKIIPYPYITLLGCMTPNITLGLIRENALSGGFSRRCLYIYADQNGPPIPIPVFTPAQQQALERLIKRGKEIQTLVGKFSLSPEGLELYEALYKLNHIRLTKETNPALLNFLQSKTNISLKISMLLSLAEGNSFIISAEHMDLASRLVDSVEPHIETIFAYTGRNPHATTIEGIKHCVSHFSKAPPFGVTQKRILGEFLKHCDSLTINQILSSLLSTDPPQLEKVVVSATGKPPVELYCPPGGSSRCLEYFKSQP